MTINTKEFLEFKVLQYNNPYSIAVGPVQIPHRFTTPEDIEISGFLASSIAWGQRKSIIKSAKNINQLQTPSLNLGRYFLVLNMKAGHKNMYQIF